MVHNLDKGEVVAIAKGKSHGMGYTIEKGKACKKDQALLLTAIIMLIFKYTRIDGHNNQGLSPYLNRRLLLVSKAYQR